jgi:hypothetical protein
LHANKSPLTVRVILGKTRKDAKKVRFNDSTIDATPLLQQEKRKTKHEIMK